MDSLAESSPSRLNASEVRVLGQGILLSGLLKEHKHMFWLCVISQVSAASRQLGLECKVSF